MKPNDGQWTLLQDLTSCCVSPPHWKTPADDRAHEIHAVVKDFREVYPDVPESQVMEWLNEYYPTLVTGDNE